jgi:MFS family permease
MLSPYRRVLAVPGALLFSTAGLVARLPISMVALGIVLLVAANTGSYGLAGAVSAAYVLANSLFAILHGRLVDTVGQSRVLPPVIAVFGAALGALMLAAQAGWPTWSVLVLAAMTGAALPQVGACVRARWSYVLTGPAGIHTAYAWESVLDEVVFVVGPVLVTLMATAWHPLAGLTVALVSGVVGTLVLAAQWRTEPPPHPRRPRRAASSRLTAPLPWRTVAPLTAVFLALGTLFGAIEVCTVAFAEERGAPEAAGFLLGLFSLGSLLAGLVTGAIPWRSSPVLRVRWGAVALALGVSPLSLIGSLWLMAPVLFVAGFAIAPTLIAVMSLAERTVPPSRLTEGMAVLHTGITAGVAPGAAVGGLLIDAYDARTAYLLAAAAGVVAVLASLSVPAAGHAGSAPREAGAPGVGSGHRSPAP